MTTSPGIDCSRHTMLCHGAEPLSSISPMRRLVTCLRFVCRRRPQRKRRSVSTCTASVNQKSVKHRCGRPCFIRHSIQCASSGRCRLIWTEHNIAIQSVTPISRSVTQPDFLGRHWNDPSPFFSRQRMAPLCLTKYPIGVISSASI